MVGLMLDIVWLCHNEGIEAEAIQRDFRPPVSGKVSEMPSLWNFSRPGAFSRKSQYYADHESGFAPESVAFFDLQKLHPS